MSDYTPVTKQLLFSRVNLIHAFSGATGSVVAMTIFYPLEIIRTRLQVDDRKDLIHLATLAAEIIRDEGWSCFYEGIRPLLISLYCSNFIYFYTYTGLKLLVSRKGLSHSAPIDLLLAAISGSVNVIITTPLWVATTRIKLQNARIRTEEGAVQTHMERYSGLTDGIVKIAREEGLYQLWSSVFSSLILVSNPAIQYMVYEMAKRRLKQTNSSLSVFLMGAFAKLISTILTYPIQVGQARQRASSRRVGLIVCLIELVQSRGVLGLYRGLETKLLQTVLTSAFMFVVYEKILLLLMKRKL
ncbi:Peroxisomal membrane protein PMP34-like [Oopsacas minuta]|uniref:Peroxisomal membrane protein PMP34-like n=1 Tax=Oopsacas minuta TaxID=111878 RepID=A0AAV7JCW8_9METZ|nr:Peroxisomal membrane protein PMP34-like [Oopsacas minuta]